MSTRFQNCRNRMKRGQQLAQMLEAGDGPPVEVPRPDEAGTSADQVLVRHDEPADGGGGKLTLEELARELVQIERIRPQTHESAGKNVAELGKRYVSNATGVEAIEVGLKHGLGIGRRRLVGPDVQVDLH
jgi:hypothetical protein